MKRYIQKIMLIIIQLLFAQYQIAFSINNYYQLNKDKDYKVVVAFDDGYYSIYKYAYPILLKYQVPATLALISNYLNDGQIRNYASSSVFMNISEVKDMVNNLTIEIASHSVSHQDLTKLSLEDVFYELRSSKLFLDSVFNQETITFVYPYGHTNNDIIELVQSTGYKLARSTKWGDVNLWVSRYLIPIKEVRKTTSIKEILNHIKNHKTTILLFHRILPTPTHFTEYSVNDFNTLMRILSRNDNIKLLTLKELYQEWWQDFMIKHIAQKGWLSYPILFDKVNIDQTRTFNTSTEK